MDPALRTVKVYRSGAGSGGYEQAAELSAEVGGAVLTTPLLPDFGLPLADLFARRARGAR